MQIALTCQFDATEDALHECDYGLVATEVDELLQAAGMPLLAHDYLDFKGLCRMLPLARQDVLQIESNRWNGVYKQPRPMGGLAPITSPTKPSGSKPFADNGHAVLQGKFEGSAY